MTVVKLQIDFTTVHLYPEAWKRQSDPKWIDKWFSDHIDVAKNSNKPLVMEEFGWNYFGKAADNQVRRNDIYDSWTKKLSSWCQLDVLDVGCTGIIG
jgi:endo-1,4-beta-mannosidase